MDTIVEWKENNALGNNVHRAFKYDGENIYSFVNYENVGVVGINSMANLDLDKIKTHAARKLVAFCKELVKDA